LNKTSGLKEGTGT